MIVVLDWERVRVRVRSSSLYDLEFLHWVGVVIAYWMGLGNFVFGFRFLFFPSSARHTR